MAVLKPALLILPAVPANAAGVVDLALTHVDYRQAVKLTELSVLLGRRAVVLVVPAEQAVVSRVAIPAQHRRQAARALPWAVEDLLLAPPEHYHIALGPADEGAWLVSWVEHAWLAAWLSRLHSVGVRTLAWMPQAALLPTADAAWVLAARDNDWLLQTAPGSAITLAEADLPASLALLSAQAESRPPIRVYARAEAHARVRALLDPLGWALTAEASTDLPALARHASTQDDAPWRLTLPGQGDSDAEGRVRQRVLRRLGAGLAAYALAFAGSHGQDADGVRALAARRSQAEALVLESFPELRRVVQPRAQMQQGLTALKRSLGLQGVLALLGPPLQQAPGVRLQTLEYTPEVLRLVLYASDLLTLDQFIGVLNQALPDYRARMEGAGPEGAEFTATVRIETKTP